MRKVIQIFCLICLLIAVGFVSSEAFAAKQKYTRQYQKKKVYVQKKKPYFQKQDLPVANAYLQVKRKKPSVQVDYVPGQTVFKTESDNVICNGKNSPGCTVFAVSFSAAADCETSVITLNVSETQQMTTLISSAYQKGTCFFDQILKHELLHETVFRKVLDSFIQKTAQDLMLTYEAGQNTSKSCKEIQKRIAETAREADKSFADAVREEHEKLDSEQGGHTYQLDVCEREQNE
ncbi:MAG: hypothetical protein ACI4TE_04345 [Alphaproteobacteria bacterium]